MPVPVRTDGWIPCYVLAVFSLAALTACKPHDAHSGPTPPSPRPHAQAADASSSQANSHVAANAQSARADAGGEVDLLRAVPTTVAVSSVVANPTDIPPHMADGDLETAWSSRTGELEHTWVAIRVPSTASVTGIALTAGYTKQTPAHDLFTSNVRIQRVRVSHNGAVVGEYPLDVEDRGLQRLPVSGSGGDWKLEFIGIQPGSQHGWREVCVSELKVWGAPNAPAAAQPVTPTYRLGDLDHGESWSDVADDRVLDAAIGTMRTALNGSDPMAGGCGQDTSGTCVAQAWEALAQAAAHYAQPRCASQQAFAQALAAYTAAVAAFDRANAHFQQVATGSGDPSSAEHAVTSRAGDLTSATSAMLQSCVAAVPAFAALSTHLVSQDVQNYHWTGPGT